MHSKTYLVGLFALSVLNSSSVSALPLPTWYLERLAEQQQQQQQLQQFQENLHQQDQEFQQQQEFLQPSSHDSSHLFLSTLPTPAQGTSELVVRGVPDPSTTVDTPPPTEKLQYESEESDNNKEQKKEHNTGITVVEFVGLLSTSLILYPLALLAKQMLYNISLGIIAAWFAATIILYVVLPRVDEDILTVKLVGLTYAGAMIVALVFRGAGYVCTWMKTNARNVFSVPWVLNIRFRFNSQPVVLKIGNVISESGSAQVPVASVAGSSEGADLALPERMEVMEV